MRSPIILGLVVLLIIELAASKKPPPANKPAGIKPYCGEGWKQFAGKCYSLFNKKVGVYEAEKICRSYNGHLASANTKKEFEFLGKVAPVSIKGGRKPEGEWLGVIIDHSKRPAAVSWSDGTNDTFVKPHWRFGWRKTIFKFNNWPKGSSAARLVKKKGKRLELLDMHPSYKYRFICERTPLSGCEKGLERFGNNCYKLYKSAKNFKDAESSCKAMKGHLASACNQQQYDFLDRHLRIHGAKDAWIGMEKDMKTYVRAPKYSFSWTSGCKPTFKPPGLCDKSTPVASLQYGKGCFNAKEADKKYFFCQKKAKGAALPSVPNPLPNPWAVLSKRPVRKRPAKNALRASSKRKLVIVKAKNANECSKKCVRCTDMLYLPGPKGNVCYHLMPKRARGGDKCKGCVWKTRLPARHRHNRRNNRRRGRKNRKKVQGKKRQKKPRKGKTAPRKNTRKPPQKIVQQKKKVQRKNRRRGKKNGKKVQGKRRQKKPTKGKTAPKKNTRNPPQKIVQQKKKVQRKKKVKQTQQRGKPAVPAMLGDPDFSA